MSDEGVKTSGEHHLRADGQEIDLLLSGGGFRGMFASVGVLLYLIHRELWSQVRLVISVSGGSVTNGALVAMWTDDEAYGAHTELDRLREYVARLRESVLNPFASVRRTLITARFLVVLAALVLVLVSSFRFQPSWLPSGLLPFAVGVMFVPVTIQLIRSYLTVSMRSYIETATGSRQLSIAVAHSALCSEAPAEQRSRQHVFCTTGLVSGRPYYFWVGGGKSLDAKPGEGEMLWGAPLPPHNEQNDYTIGEAVFGSSSLPLLGNVMSPMALDLTGAERFTSPHRELLIDGGGSGILGQQVLNPFASDLAMVAELETERPPRTTIAVDCFRHIPQPPASLKARLIDIFRRRMSTITFLLSWVKLGSEALYVGDLIDATDGYLIRVCEPAEHVHSPSELMDVPEPMAQAFRSLRTRVNQLELYNKTPDKVANAIAAGFVGAWLALEPSNTAQLDEALKHAGRSLYGDDNDNADSLYNAWQQVGGTSCHPDVS